MEKNNQVSLAIVIPNCICAVICIVNLLVDLICGQPDGGILVLHIICAIAWTVCAAVWVTKYIRTKKQDA